MFFIEFFGFPLAVSLHRCSILIDISSTDFVDTQQLTGVLTNTREDISEQGNSFPVSCDVTQLGASNFKAEGKDLPPLSR
jgi:hypothetical protein